MKLFKISEIKTILKVSHTTVYKKLNKLDKVLKDHIIKEKNVIFVTEKGLEILKKNINKSNNSNNFKQLNQPLLNPFKDEIINTLKEQLNYLKSELSKNSKTLSTLIETQTEEKNELIQ